MADLTPETLREWAVSDRILATAARHAGNSEAEARYLATADILDGIAAAQELNHRDFAALYYSHETVAAALIALGQQSKEGK